MTVDRLSGLESAHRGKIDGGPGNLVDVVGQGVEGDGSLRARRGCAQWCETSWARRQAAS